MINITNLRKGEKEISKGISLIALVITIIILLILAGVTIAMLTGENGLIAKAIKAKEEHQMNEYKERLNLIIIEEIAERKTESKKELMIKSLDQKIRTKESSWVHEIYKCNEQKQEQKTFEASTHLLVESKEHYEFFIEVNEEENTASIVSQEKGSGKTWKVTYHPNGAEGKEEVVEVKQGFTITTKEC